MEVSMFMRPAFRSGFILFFVGQLFSIAISQIVPESAPTSPVKLDVGTPIERELKGGETHRYSFSIEAGRFASVVVDQRGIDVVLRLKAPDGHEAFGDR